LSEQFYIEAECLASHSKKPKYLETRMQNVGENPNPKRTTVFEQRLQRLKDVNQKKRVVLQKTKKALEAVRNGMANSLSLRHERAERNRTELLEKKQELFGNNVHKAKVIAMNSKQKRVEQKIELQLKIEERLRLSASRRVLFQRLRTNSQEPVELMESEEISARIIQNWYRLKKFAPIKRIYKKIGVDRLSSSRLSFRQLSARLQHSVLIKAADFAIIRAKRIAGSKDKFKTPGKVLLSSWMLYAYPSEVLSQNDGQEADLRELADKVTLHLDYWMSCTKAHLVAPLGIQFFDSFQRYYSAFVAWKDKDKHTIIEDLIKLFLELDQVWVKVLVKQDDSVEEWQYAIGEHQEMHLKRIKLFGKDALDKLISKRQEFQDHVRSTMSEAVVVSSLADPLCFANEMYTPLEVIEAVPDATEAPQPVPADFGSILSNQQLAHEMVMDPNFKLKKPKMSELEERVSAMAKKALSDAIKTEYDFRVLDKGVFNLVSDIRAGLLGMVNEGGAIYNEIAEVFDMEFLKEQISNTVFDLKAIVGYTGEKMLQLCAPAQDQQIKALSSKENIIDVMFEMLDILEEMKLGLANFRLMTLKPQLIRESVEYERNQFNKSLSEGTVSLSKTESWLQSSVADIQKVIEERTPENAEVPESTIKYSKVYCHGILEILFSTSAVDIRTLPETFVLDAKRIFEFQNELQAMTIVAALAMLSSNIIPELRREEEIVNEMAQTLFDLLEKDGTSLDILSDAIVSCTNVIFHKQTKIVSNLGGQEQKLKEVSQEQVKLIKAMVQKTLSSKDPLFSVLSRRIRKIVRLVLETEKEFKSSELKKHGLDSIETKLIGLLKRISVLVTHNRNVYGGHYDVLIQKHLKD